MNIDKSKLASRFTEVVARSMDVRDQQHEGTNHHFNHDRWITRYQGRTDLPPTMVEFNTFKPMVDMIVSQLMLSLDDDAWAAANKPLFKES